MESSFLHPRDENLRLIRKGGRSKWKEHSGYGVMHEKWYEMVRELWGV